MGSNSLSKLWEKEVWDALYPLLLNVISDEPQKASIYAGQFVKATQKEKNYSNMQIGDSSVLSWLPTRSEEVMEFFDAEVWYPAKTRCVKTKSLPSVYIMIKNMQIDYGIVESKNKCNQAIYIVIDNDYYSRKEFEIVAYIKALASESNAIHVLESTYRNHDICDFDNFSFFYKGYDNDTKPEIEKLKGDWNPTNWAK